MEGNRRNTGRKGERDGRKQGGRKRFKLVFTEHCTIPFHTYTFFDPHKQSRKVGISYLNVLQTQNYKMGLLK